MVIFFVARVLSSRGRGLSPGRRYRSRPNRLLLNIQNIGSWAWLFSTCDLWVDYNSGNTKGGIMFPSWLTKPEMLVTYGLFLAAALISIYSTDIRAIFSIPGRKYREVRMALLQQELKHLQYLHENTYGLLLYITRSVFDGLSYIAVGFFLATAIQIVIVIATGQKTPVPITQFTGGWLGYNAGFVVSVSRRINALWNYHARSKEIESKIARLKGAEPTN
jgi:hypothetical protein